MLHKTRGRCFYSGMLPLSSDGWVHCLIGLVTFKVDADNSTEGMCILNSTMAMKTGCYIGW